MSLFARPAVPPEVQAREDRWNRDKEACLARFKSAVEAAKRRDYRQSEAIIASVRERHGEKAAAIAATELKKAIQR
jgi:hypothetical protein